jgi:hypothetical protein
MINDGELSDSFSCSSQSSQSSTTNSFSEASVSTSVGSITSVTSSDDSLLKISQKIRLLQAEIVGQAFKIASEIDVLTPMLFDILTQVARQAVSRPRFLVLELNPLTFEILVKNQALLDFAKAFRNRDEKKVRLNLNILKQYYPAIAGMLCDGKQVMSIASSFMERMLYLISLIATAQDVAENSIERLTWLFPRKNAAAVVNLRNELWHVLQQHLLTNRQKTALRFLFQ